MIAIRVLGITSLAVLAGCAVNPYTGRSQLIALPAAQIAHADMGFTLAAAAKGLTRSTACLQAESNGPFVAIASPACTSAENLAKFSRQVERIGAELTTAARALSPELFTRISTFQIRVEPDTGTGTASSAGGRITLDASLAALEPTDDVVAFLIAREMGSVIARHGEEDSGARMTFSAITTFLPGGAILRLVASMLGSQALKSTWADGRQREADDIALTLLERGNRSARVISLNLRIGINRMGLPSGEWATGFAQSVSRVEAVALAQPKPQPETRPIAFAGLGYVDDEAR